MKLGFHPQRGDINRDLKWKTQKGEEEEEGINAANPGSVQQPLLRGWMITFRTPAMVSQPNIMASRRNDANQDLIGICEQSSRTTEISRSTSPRR